jgi:hypothetical protein
LKRRKHKEEEEFRNRKANRKSRREGVRKLKNETNEGRI